MLLQSLVFEAYYHDICLGQLRGLKTLKHSWRNLFQPLFLLLCRNFDISQVAFLICISSLYKSVQFVSSYQRYRFSLVFVYFLMWSFVDFEFPKQKFLVTDMKISSWFKIMKIKSGLKNFWLGINDKVWNMSTKYTEFIISMKYV